MTDYEGELKQRKHMYFKVMRIFRFSLIILSSLLVFFYMILGFRQLWLLVGFLTLIVTNIILYFDAMDRKDSIDDFRVLYYINKIQQKEEENDRKKKKI